LADDIHVQENTLLDDQKIKTMIYDIFERHIVPTRLFHPVSQEYASVRDHTSARTTA
jgi:hypothetical protein